MQIGNLPRARAARMPLGSAVAQVALLLLTVGLLTSGWLILSSLQGESSSDQGAVAGQRVGVSEPQPGSPPSRIPSLQTANAEPTDAILPGGSTLSDPPAEPGSDAGLLRVPAAVDRSPAPAPPVSPAPASDVPSPKPDQAQNSVSLLVPAPPAASDVTNAVSVEASRAADPDQSNSLIDLNSSTFEQLNGLRGGGLIGRAIIKGRPYSSVQDLVIKKVLRRSVYEKIKDQITVR